MYHFIRSFLLGSLIFIKKHGDVIWGGLLRAVGECPPSVLRCRFPMPFYPETPSGTACLQRSGGLMGIPMRHPQQQWLPTAQSAPQKVPTPATQADVSFCGAVGSKLGNMWLREPDARHPSPTPPAAPQTFSRGEHIRSPARRCR